MFCVEQQEAREHFLVLGRRLKENVARGLPDQAEGMLKVPAQSYRDETQFQAELEHIFFKVPLLAALSCDIPEPGDFVTHTIVDRPLLIVRGDDGVARVFLNVCRHRGAALTCAAEGHSRVFVCPYHSWTYDRQGKLSGVPDAQTFGEHDVEGLIELPSDEAVGTIFCSLDPKASVSVENWLGELYSSLASLRLENMHAYRKLSTLESPNWKLAADGYLDGYHIGYLHKDTIGRKSINNRNTYDFGGPHVRIGFANKGINQIDEKPVDDLIFPECLSLVHYIYPNVSISGGHGDTIQLSRLFPGPKVHQSTTIQHQYFRSPLEGEMIDVAEEKRIVYEQVVRDEDCSTIFTISEALPAMQDSPIVFGRNEMANQHLHQTIAEMTAR